VFRAVENRLGVARSVNTGISALIDPDGRVSQRVEADPTNPWPRANNYEVGTIRVDSRYALYSQYGDWFSWVCTIATLLLFLDYWVTRARTRGLALEDDVEISDKKRRA
jgi:apolipoprotein N-acyltransferase